MDVEKLKLSDHVFDLDFQSTVKTMRDWLFEEQGRIEEKVIKQVIGQYLGEPCTIVHAPNVQRIFHVDYHDRYILTYNGNQLGMVRYLNDLHNFTVEFTPNQFTL